jgi:O-antigen/teichoic acid export membrane protein
MGIVLRQGYKNTIFTYLGFLIGGIYTVLLVPKVFDAHPEHWGTARYLVSFAMIIVPWAQLSLPNVIIRYFPIFKEKREKDFMFFVLFWASVGIIISSIVILIYTNYWFDGNTSPLITDNIYLIFPIFIGYVLFEITAAISKSLLKSTVPVFLREFALRSSVLVLILLYWYEIISFNFFIVAYALNYIANFTILFAYLYYLKALKFNINFGLLKDIEFKYIYVYALFSILSTGAAIFLLNIDTLMINHYLSLKDVAIYGPSIYIASSIMIPSRSLQSIIAPVVAKSWVSNDITLIKSLYKKSAIAPLSITIFLFLMIWINIDLVMDYFGKVFGQGKYIILFLSFGHIINIATGINGTIINTSKHYKADLYFQVALVFMTVIMNIIFIPIYGLNGAALATGITLAFHNSLKSLFVLYKFKIHPFTLKTVYVLIIGVVLFIVIDNMPQIQNLLVSSIVYTIAFSFIYWIIVYFTNISEDINEQINKIIRKVF